MGTVDACTVFYDDPAFAEELLDFYTDFTMETIHQALHEVDIDYFNIFEDMAGKGGPLVSPRIFRKFMLPRYRRIADFVRSHGVEFVAMDSDGDVRALIPLIMEAGINILWPLEIAAGVEPLDVRKEYGRDLRLWGGIDKRELAKGRKEVEHELMRQVPALLEDGGYIPHVDHDVPPDVPYDNFLYYLELKRRIAEGRDGA
jgi:uroporphyrinogen decarboxylase